MSVARIYPTTKSRKVWTCGSCGTVLPIGSPVLSFAVGFRGYDQKRCTKPECYPSLSQRESSAVATVYAAQENFDLGSCTSLDDLVNAVQDVADACDEVADEYESNEMIEVNQDLQERADTVRSAGEELEGWDADLDEEPTEDDEDEDEGEDFDTRHEAWLDEARAVAQEAIDSMELP